LEKALRVYDGGLYRGQFDPAKIRIDIGEDRKTAVHGHTAVRRTVTIDGYDPFVTRKPLTTHLEVFRWYCPQTRRTLVLILRSPRSFVEKDTVWKTLLPFASEIPCHAQD
jgi:hypothetical protein